MRTGGQLFYAADSGCLDDKITLEGFGRGIAMCGLKISPASTRKLFESFDVDYDGFITWHELKAKWM